MARTRHIEQRMSQRAITAEMLDVVKQFGSWSGDKCIVNKKACTTLLEALDKLRKKIVRVQEKGGVVLVESRGAEITAYSLDSYKKY